MARAASLPSLGLSPFGGGGSSFDAFSIGQAKSEKAYLAFRKVEVEWEAGRISDSDYLAALRTYASSLKANTSERVGADARVKAYTERFERNAIESAIKGGTKTYEDLLAFDRAHLEGVNPASEEYQSRVGQINNVQNQIFNDLQDKKQEEWSDGLITTAQLLSWYQGLRPDLLADNPDLAENVGQTVDDLLDRARDEKDSKALSDFSSGKMAPDDFLAYATAARARYTKGTQQYQEWNERIDEAKDQSIEDSLLYRYDLSQRYAQLAKFVQDHGKAPSGGTSKSTSTRVVWDGSKWVTKKTTSTKAYGPSASEQKAWAELQIEVADAKRQMAQIAKKIGRVPGAWVTTDDMIGYYKKQRSRYAAGSSEWYAIQGKLDSLNQQKHAEAVLSKQGIRVSYPKTAKDGGGATGGNGRKKAAATKTAGAGGGTADSFDDGEDVTLDEFMRAIAKVESGGRYDAVNKSSGAYGKYQIMPANWPGWAEKFLGDRNAKPTPENQEKVARAKFRNLYRWLGSWKAVAHWWLTGGSDKGTHNDPSAWSASSRAYVNKVFAKLGQGPVKVAAKGGGAAGGSGGGGGASASTGSGSSAVATTSGAAGGAKTGTADDGGGAKPKEKEKGSKLRDPLNFPKGYDGRQFEDFYDAFKDAWEDGEDTFTTYIGGKAISYFIETDPTERADLMADLDEMRVAYYVEKSEAYLNKDGSPTSSSIYAVKQANDAIVDAAENQLTALSFEKPQTTRPTVNKQTGFDMNQQDVDTPEQAARRSDALARGVRLSEKLDRQLAGTAAAAKKAYEAGNFELAYALTQQAIKAVAEAKPALDTYLLKAGAQIKTVRQAGGTVPGITNQDFDALADDVGELTATGDGMDPSLKVLDEVATDLQKILKLDPDGEPLRMADSTFQLNDNVSLVWKGGKLEIDTATAPVGWVTPTDRGQDKPRVQLGGINVGGKVLGNVQAEYTTGVIGFVGGLEQYPVYGKIVALVDPSGKQVQWAENPLTGGWYDISTQPLSIKTPTGFKAIASEGGSKTGGTAMDFGFTTADGDGYRMVYDPTDGKYVLYQEGGGGPFASQEPIPIGKVGGGKNDDLAAIIASGGWDVDMTNRTGELRTFSGLQAPVVGMSASEWTRQLNNSGLGPRAGIRAKTKAEKTKVAGGAGGGNASLAGAIVSGRVKKGEGVTILDLEPGEGDRVAANRPNVNADALPVTRLLGQTSAERGQVRVNAATGFNMNQREKPKTTAAKTKPGSLTGGGTKTSKNVGRGTRKTTEKKVTPKPAKSSSPAPTAVNPLRRLERL